MNAYWSEQGKASNIFGRYNHLFDRTSLSVFVDQNYWDSIALAQYHQSKINRWSTDATKKSIKHVTELLSIHEGFSAVYMKFNIDT